MNKKEIKFRVWDKKNNRWNEDGNGYTENSEEYVQDCEGTSINMLIDFVLGSGNYELVQYTGLKDKNEKEIYCGDLMSEISYSYNEKTKKHDIPIRSKVIQEVVWGEINNSALEQGGSRDSRFVGWGLKYKGSDYLYEICGEIVGNIYENPNLIK